MLAKTAIVCLALGLLAPNLARAANPSGHFSLAGKKGKTLRVMLAAELNKLPGTETGLIGKGKFTQSRIKGSVDFQGGFAGTSYSIRFTEAVPSVKIGKKTQYFGGCFGRAKTLRFAKGNFTEMEATIDGKLRNLAGGL